MVSIEIKAETPEELAETVRRLEGGILTLDRKAMRDEAMRVLKDVSRMANLKVTSSATRGTTRQSPFSCESPPLTRKSTRGRRPRVPFGCKSRAPATVPPADATPPKSRA